MDTVLHPLADSMLNEDEENEDVVLGDDVLEGDDDDGDDIDVPGETEEEVTETEEEEEDGGFGDEDM